MGNGCSCKSPDDNIKSVISASTRRSSSINQNKPMEDVVEKLREYYKAEENHIDKKIRVYFDQVFTGVSQFTTLISLRLCAFSEQDFDHLSRVLPFYPRCTEFTIWKSHLTTKSVTYLCSSISLLTSLKILSLQDSHLHDESLLCASHAFPCLTNITEIWLSYNDITPAGAAILAISLAGFPRLAIVNLDFNFVQNEGCKDICEALANRSRIKVLGLRGNKITDGALISLKKLGESNPPELNLDLQNNSLSPSACNTLKCLYGDIVNLGRQDVAQ